MTADTYTYGDGLRTQITENLERFERRTIEDDTLRRAAVAIVVVGSGDSDTASILLTLRPPGLRRHSRQFALPGGRLDAGETAIEAALRELHEELGIALGQDTILGLLDDYPTRSGFAITPVVAWAEADPEITPEPEEVDQVFRIPFPELDSAAIPHFHNEQEGEPPVLSSRFPAVGNRMFAPTAAMIYQFREVAIRGLDTRVDHYGQPQFAWK